MFENIGTALVQAVGFFGIFGFFVYQLLSDGRKTITTKVKYSEKKLNLSKDLKEKPKKKGLFNRKVETKKVIDKPKKKGIFGRKVERIEVLEKPKKKGWFN